jgi:hypothetical protein
VDNYKSETFEGKQCSGTHCGKSAVGFHNEFREVPAWRHPVDRPNQKAVETVAISYYCADHEKEALGDMGVTLEILHLARLKEAASFTSHAEA